MWCRMDEELVLVRFALDPKDWHGSASEGVWAKPVKSSGGTIYELRNSPFYARNVSYTNPPKV